jgi:hypothetical protein
VGTEEQGREEDARQVQEPEVSEEERAADTVLKEQEETVSTSEDKLREVEANARKKHRLNPVKRNRKLAAIRAVRSAMQSLSGIAPDAKIVVHDTAESYAKAADEIERSKQDLSKGAWDPDTNTIHINLDKAGSRTVAHETFHALLFNRFKDEGKIQVASEKLISELRPALRGDAKLTAYLDEFATRYSDQDVISEEQLAELIGIIAENYNSFNARAKRAVENFINTVISSLGMDKIEGLFPEKISGNEAADMMTAIGERIAKGEVITEEDVSLIEAPEVEIDEKVAPKSKKQEDIKKNISDKVGGLNNAISNAITFASESSYPTNIDFKNALQDRFKNDQKEIKKNYGVKSFTDLGRKGENQQLKEYLVDAYINETLIALQAYPDALGWYDAKTKAAMSVMSLIHPELATDKDAEQAFKIVLAITSNGNKVFDNFKEANRQYEYFKENGRFDEKKSIGTQSAGIKASLKLVNNTLEVIPMSDFSRFLNEKFTVRDLKYKDKNGKTKSLLSGFLANTEVYGASIFGAKIGNGFYMNLNGVFDQLTMDRWFIRQYGRLTGTLIDRDAKKVSNGETRLKNAVSKLSSKEKKVLSDLIPRYSSMSMIDLANAIERLTVKADKREIISEGNLNEVRKSGNSLAKNNRGEVEAPKGGSQRAFIIDVFDSVQERLKNDFRIDITIADLQAVNWYPEKALYKTFQEGSKEASGKEDVSDNEQPDYETAAIKLAKQIGITESQIKKASNENRRQESNIESARESVRSGAKELGTTDSKAVKRGIEEIKQSILDVKATLQPEKKPKRKKQEGAPMFSGKNKNIIDLANRYIRRKGLDKPVDQEIKKLNTEYAKNMADVYEAAKHEPLKKEVQDAYKALAQESKEQFEVLKRDGYKVELWDGIGEPYSGSKDMLEDLKKNKHLYVFSTEKGFGEKDITAKDRKENPMLEDSGYKDVNGNKLLLNDLFRFVHDAFGHGKLGNSFGPIGEENAWYVHSQMFSPAARRAMTSETRGQNSWVNFGPQLRNSDGSLPKKGDKNYISPANRDFAEQKNFLFPDEYVFDRPNTQGRFEESGKKPKLKKQEVAKNSKASVDAIKKVPLKEEDGVTLNVDGTPYQGGGLIVPFESINLNQPSITPQDISTFVDERSEKISSDSFKVGLYKFPEESTVSIDLNVVVPSENRDVAVEFAKFLGQESVYDIDTGENIKTGATGMETLTLTNEETIEAEKALMENKMPKFKKKKEEDVKQRGFFTNKFDSVKNWLETRSGQEGIVDHILENPETYYTKQKLSEVEDKLKFMTESQLVEAMSTDALYNLTNRATSSFNTLQGGPAVPENIGILAAVENINRKLEKNQPIDSDVIMLGKFGTALGQLLRQMGHIKSSTPAGALLVIEKIADKYNVSLTKENRRVLEGKIKDRFAITSEIDKLVEKIRRKDITDSEFKDLDKKIKDLQSDLENVHTFTQRYLAKAIPLPFFKAFGVMLQGALLTTGSIVTNAWANVFQTGQFLGTNVLASTAEMARIGTEKVFGLKPKERNFSVSIGGILYGTQTAIGSLPNIFRTLFWKGPKEDYIELQHADIRSNILGWRALTVLFSRKMALPTPKEGNTIDKIIGKFNKELGEKKLAAKLDIFLSLLSQGTMGIYPDASFRALQAGDLLFKVPWKNFSLYEKARRKGLKGAELKAFLKYPDKKSYDEAVQLAKEATFQEESKIAVKTPANLVNLTIKVVFPELAYATSAYHYAKGNYRQGAMNFGIATTGIMMTSAASMLVANGLVQDSGEDDDADERGQKYIVFPPNTINITAFNRVKDWIKEGYDTSDTEFINRLNMLYKGEAPKELTNPRVTDVKRNYMKSGIPGAVVGIYAQTRAETIKEANSKDLLNPSKKGYFSALGRDVLNLPSVISYMTQQSFLQGAYGVMNALAGSDHETKMWYLNTVKAVSSVPLPNQLSVINRAEREYLPDFRHRDWEEQFKNVLLDKTFGTSALPVRRDMWGRRIRQTPEGVNPVVFQYGLDPTRPYKGKESPTDEDKMVNAAMEELYTLWDRTRDSKIYPDPVDDRQSLKWKGESRGIYFSPQSKNDYQMIVGGARLNRVVNELSNKNKRRVWDRMTDDQKINKLSKLYRVNDVIVKEIPQEIRDRYGITQKSPTIEKIKIFISQHELMKMIEEGREIE